MRKGELNVSRSRLWSAWDANTHVYRQPPKIRRLLRRIIKHQQKAWFSKEARLQIEDDQRPAKDDQ